MLNGFVGNPGPISKMTAHNQMCEQVSISISHTGIHSVNFNCQFQLPVSIECWLCSLLTMPNRIEFYTSAQPDKASDKEFCYTFSNKDVHFLN